MLSAVVLVLASKIELNLAVSENLEHSRHRNLMIKRNKSFVLINFSMFNTILLAMYSFFLFYHRVLVGGMPTSAVARLTSTPPRGPENFQMTR